MALVQHFLCFVPVAIFHGTLQVGSMVSVKIREDPILIPQSSIDSLGWILNRGKASRLLRLPLCRGCREASSGRGRGEDAGGKAAQSLSFRSLPRKHSDYLVPIDLSGMW